LRFAFAPAERFFAPVFGALFADFFGDFLAAFDADFFVADFRLPPLKMLSQLSEYCFVAPTRTMLMGVAFSNLTF
jgi:hypothetical protein